MNGRLEPYQLAEIHRHLDDRDALYDRMQRVSVDDVLEAMPDEEIRGCGEAILEAIGRAETLPPAEGDTLIHKAIVAIRSDYLRHWQEIA